MRKGDTPPKEYLDLLFRYEEETGRLIWRERSIEHFATTGAWKTFNVRDANKPAGCIVSAKNGRKYVSINLRQGGAVRHYLAHRLIWVMLHGSLDSDMDVDHADRDGLNNRPTNLRSATRSQNICNAVGRKSRYGLKGVGLHRNSGLFFSTIIKDGKVIHCGYHKTKGLAAIARAKAALRHHGEFARYT